MTGGRASYVGRGYELALRKCSLADTGRAWAVLAGREPGKCLLAADTGRAWAVCWPAVSPALVDGATAPPA